MVRISIDVVNGAYQFLNTIPQREICLRNLQIQVIENLDATKDQFDVIDLTDNYIKKLDNLPVLKRLDTLLLHNNHVETVQKTIGEKLPKLRTLALTNNKLAEFRDIVPLAKCKKLEYLILIGNPLSYRPHYRLYVIHTLKSVRVLDFCRVRDKERKAAKELFEKGSQKVNVEALPEKISQEVNVEAMPEKGSQEISVEALPEKISQEVNVCPLVENTSQDANMDPV